MAHPRLFAWSAAVGFCAVLAVAAVWPAHPAAVPAAVCDAPADAVFTGILGFDGHIATELGAGSWASRTYCTVRDGEPLVIAESFGYGEPQDYAIDLDGDGVTELVTNVQYGGDGAQRVYIYQRRNSDIYRGGLSPDGLPNFDDRGAASYLSEYDPERGLFRLRYAQKSSEEYGLLETYDLSRFLFTHYAP